MLDRDDWARRGIDWTNAPRGKEANFQSGNNRAGGDSVGGFDSEGRRGWRPRGVDLRTAG
jgi:hypothetical protein